jgi:hypothetical protein
MILFTRRKRNALCTWVEEFFMLSHCILFLTRLVLTLYLYTWGHYATSRKVAASIPSEAIGFFNWPNPSSRTMALRSTQPLTEMSTRNVPVDKWRPARKAENSPPSVSQLYRKCGNLDVSQPHGTPLPLRGIALLVFFFFTYMSAPYEWFLWLLHSSYISFLSHPFLFNHPSSLQLRVQTHYLIQLSVKASFTPLLQSI